MKISTSLVKLSIVIGDMDKSIENKDMTKQ
jgi:hypothetical protein